MIFGVKKRALRYLQCAFFYWGYVMQHRFLCVALSVFLLSGCSLLVPNVEPEIIQLKAGDYRLDRSHGALIFKIQHMGLSTFVGRFNHFDVSLN